MDVNCMVECIRPRDWLAKFAYKNAAHNTKFLFILLVQPVENSEKSFTL